MDGQSLDEDEDEPIPVRTDWKMAEFSFENSFINSSLSIDRG